MSDTQHGAATQPASVPDPTADIAPAALESAAEQHSKLTGRPRWLRGITRTVLVLGVVALFTDMSSEMIMPLRLLLLVQVLNTPLALAGLVEGVAEGATSLLKLVAGRRADRVTDRRGLVIAGYSVSNLSKPLLALAGNWQVALGLILIDRSGKSVRGSPRDAMLAESVPAEQRGKAFGFHRSADTLGAAIGPLLAIAILATTAGSLRAVFAWTFVPGMLSIICAVAFLRDPRERAATSNTPSQPLSQPPLAEPATQTTPAARERIWQGLGSRFWLFVVISTIFALGNSSDAFLFLRTAGLESSLIAVPMVYFGFNVVYALLATPLGSLSDRFGRLPVLAGGYAAFALVYFGWTRAVAPWHVWALFLLYGVYYAATEGIARAFVSDIVPRERRGTALGWFAALTGAAALPANIVAAWLWSQFGPGATFGLAAWLGAVALALLCAWWPWLRANAVPWPNDTARIAQLES